MTKEEVISFLNQGREIVIEPEEIILSMYKDIIYIINEDEMGYRIILDILNTEEEICWNRMKLKDETD